MKRNKAQRKQTRRTKAVRSVGYGNSKYARKVRARRQMYGTGLGIV